MITSNNKEIINFSTRYYGEYDYSKKINPHGLRSIDLMGKGSLAELYSLMVDNIKKYEN